MAGRIRMSFHLRILTTLMIFFWSVVAIFMVFQYQREKEFKAALLDSELQMHNERILDDLRHGIPIAEIAERISAPIAGLRITLIDRKGDVVFDNNYSTPQPRTNHNNRPEIMAARRNGKGFIVGRHSESDDIDYFYSARSGDNGMVVRSAVPYDHSLEDFLKADSSLIWTMLGLALTASILVYFATRRISLSIVRLNNFAEKAERGDSIFSEEPFPHDELGSIASHIVRLYIQRDRQHRETLRTEQDKIRLKKQLTNNINHELKTPVASMIICLDLLRDHPEIPEEKKNYYIGLIRKDAMRLNSMLKDVSLITRMDEGGERITKEDVGMRPLIESVIEEERLRTEMRIETDIPDITVFGNRTLLESIFRNLIGNAIAYSGGTTIRIEADRDGNFSVRDDGCGIPEVHLPHIFERFYRIDKGRSRNMGGTGLGLSIVRNAVQFHGGRITVCNNSGLCFRFTLPIKKK